MGLIRVEIELIRNADLVNAKDGLIKEEDIKRMKVMALVDTGASGLVLNEHIARQLNLTEVEKTAVILADGSLVEVKIVTGVEVRYKTRRTYVDAIVVPGKAEVLLGAIALEGMDLMIDVQTDQLIIPPDRPYMKELSLRGITRN